MSNAKEFYEIYSTFSASKEEDPFYHLRCSQCDHSMHNKYGDFVWKAYYIQGSLLCLLCYKTNRDPNRLIQL